MKGTFFNKPLEWNIETQGESWQQGETLKGKIRVKNHGTENLDLSNSGVGLSHAEIKKIQNKVEGALRSEFTIPMGSLNIKGGEEIQTDFTFKIGSNNPVTDKKSSYYLCFGKHFNEAQLQIKIVPKELYLKVSGLLDTFYRFKLKEFKAVKKGVEFKFIPPTSREMANIEHLLLTYSMEEDHLKMSFLFQVKKLDTSSVKTKINKESVHILRTLLFQRIIL
jgi:hypothetical protein